MLLNELFLIEALQGNFHKHTTAWFNISTGEIVDVGDEDSLHLEAIFHDPEKFGTKPDEIDYDSYEEMGGAEDWAYDYDEIFSPFHRRAYDTGWIRWRYITDRFVGEMMMSGRVSFIKQFINSKPFVNTIKTLLGETEEVQIYMDLINRFGNQSEHNQRVTNMIQFNDLRRQVNAVP